MALDLGTLSFTLKIRDEQLQQTLRGVPEQGRTAGRQMADGFTRDANGRLHGANGRFLASGRKIGAGLGTGAEAGVRPSLTRLGGLFAGLGIASMVGSLLGFGTRTAMTMEKASISFTTLLGSGKKAQAFLTKLRDFADKTPFEFTELSGSASQLLAAGVSASKIIPIMTTLGNVTSGMGTGSEGIQSAVVALQQMNAAGKITGEDLNQLRNAGIPVYDLLAASTGKSVEQVAALAQAGKLGGKDLAAMMKALETGKGLERFNGLMDEQSRSLEGRIATLKDAVGGGLAGALTPMMPSIKEGIGAFTAALPGIIANIQGFGSWVVQNQGWLKALAIGLGVTAAAFMVLNIVMSANPISLIVLAIAGLIAGLVWAYENVTWFRIIVDGAFKVIGAAAIGLWNTFQPVFQAIGALAVWLWNTALAPQLRGILIGFGWVATGLAWLLDAMSVLPGFGWAKDAANGLRSMATSANDAAAAVGNIPDPTVDTGKGQAEVTALDKKIQSIKNKIVTAKAKGDDKEVDRLKKKLRELKDKKVKVEANVKKTGVTTIKTINAGGGLRISAYARGGRFLPGWALVGEQGPELVKFNGTGNVYTAQQTRKMLANQAPQPRNSRAGMTLNVVNHYPQAEPTSVTTNRALAIAATLEG
jgi:tape measure domain-containing protein